MKTKRMGRTGLKVSEICLGTMTFGRQCDEASSFSIMDTAVEMGVDFFDTADVYPVGGGLDTVGRTEELVGKWLKGKRDKTNRGCLASISVRRSTGVYAVCRPITSIFTRCTRRTQTHRWMKHWAL